MARKRQQKKVAANPVPFVAGLAILTLAVFAQVSSHSFLNYDDGQFVTENPHVIHGLTAESIGWAIA